MKTLYIGEAKRSEANTDDLNSKRSLGEIKASVKKKSVTSHFGSLNEIFRVQIAHFIFLRLVTRIHRWRFVPVNFDFLQGVKEYAMLIAL